MMIAGLITIAVGVAVTSHDLVVGLILLFLVPLAIAFCGALLAFIGLARQREGGSRSAVILRIIGGTAVACLGSWFGFGCLSILSQLPDWFAGLNGVFRSDSNLGFFAFAGLFLLTGLGLGILIALGWWTVRGRHQLQAAPAQRPH